MFNLNKNYGEIAYRMSKGIYVPQWVTARQQFLSSIVKVCPKCGTILPLNAKGCSTCLQQFTTNKRRKKA